MKVDFIPRKFTNVLAEETVSKNGKWVQRIFSYEKPSANGSMARPMVMVQNIQKVNNSWLVTDYEILNVKTGKLVKSLSRRLGATDIFISDVKKQKLDGTYDTIALTNKFKSR